MSTMAGHSEPSTSVCNYEAMLPRAQSLQICVHGPGRDGMEYSRQYLKQWEHGIPKDMK